MFLESPVYYTIPEATAQAAHAAFPKGHMYLRLRDELGPLYTNPDFAHLFPTHGQPALAPARLALVTVMQMVDGLSDVEAADAVRDRLSWKYALALDLNDPGFDASVLCEFRKRLLAGGAEAVLLDALLKRLVDQGLLKPRGRQRSDSTHVLASIRTLTRLMLVGETLRAALNAIALVAPDWLQALSPPTWFERYGRRVEEYRLPNAKGERAELAATIGGDGVQVLQAVYRPTTPAVVRALPAVDILRQVWLQQYYAPNAAGQSTWREAEDTPPSAQLIHSPYDLDARYCTKKDLHWVGYKTHITETCDADTPYLITHVETTLATVPDCKAPEVIHTALAAKALLPGDHLLDRGYVHADVVVSSHMEHGVTVVGPVPEDNHWQARAQAGFDVACFVVDWEARQATCPQGATSSKWSATHNANGHDIINIRFPVTACRACPVRTQCTRSSEGSREITVRPQAHHAVLQSARQRQHSATFQHEYAARAGIEGTLSQGIRAFDLRHTRYIGLAKTRLHQVLVAVAINLVRLFAWFTETPRAGTRTSPFAALAPQPT